MFWLPIALVAHGLNAVVFAIDKGLLNTKQGVINQPLRYATYSGLVAAMTGIVLPFGFAWPNAFIAPWALLAGAFWVMALWMFFVSLKYGESSRVVPITGSTVPVITAVVSFIFLGERLPLDKVGAVTLLVIGGSMLSIKFKGTRGIPNKVLASAILAGTFFASHFVVADYIYSNFDPFIAAFAYIRISVGLVALLLLMLSMSGAGFLQGAWKLPKLRGRKPKRKNKKMLGAVSTITIVFIANKLLGSVALISQNYAIKLSSATLVNALQGTQYIILLGIAAGVSLWAPKLFHEEVSNVALIQKFAGIAVISAGLFLII